MGNKLNKKGIELAINFIVILILAIVIFTFGVIFVFKLIPHDVSETPQYNPCENSNEKLCLEKDILELKPKQFESTRLYITNTQGKEMEFRIIAEKNIWIDKSNQVHKEDFNVSIIPIESKVMIKNNEKGELLLGVSSNMLVKSGDYIFNVNVFLPSGEKFTETQKITVRVP